MCVANTDYAFFRNTFQMALDARYAMRLVNGVNPTSWHLTTARGELPLEVAEEHWLHAASGGLSAPATEGFRLAYGGSRRLEIALSQAMSVPTATANGMEYHRSTFTLLELGRAFERLCGGWSASATAGFRLVNGGSRRLEIALAQAVSVPTATANGLEYHRSTFTLLELGRAFERLCGRRNARTALGACAMRRRGQRSGSNGSHLGRFSNNH